MKWTLVPLVIAGCSSQTVTTATTPARATASLTAPSPPPAPSSTRTASTPTATPPTERRFAISESATRRPCAGVAIRFTAGRETALVCPDEATEHGLTIVDLDDNWTPTLFASTVDGREPAFRARYLELAAGDSLDPDEGFVEMFGVVPSLAQVRARLSDVTRHACHARIDSAPIARLDQAYSREHETVVRSADTTRVTLAAQLERERAERHLPDLAAVGAIPELAAAYRSWHGLDEIHRGLVAVEQHLVCEGLLSPSDADGAMTARTATAIALYQRRHFLLPHEHLDAETRETFAADSRELDFRLALRVLRERIADAAGLIEDGTAGAGPTPILGRMLDPAAMRVARGSDAPLPEAAADLIGAATELAARELGWTTVDDVTDFLAHHSEGVHVALELPPPPAYHAPHMNLFAELDRGDVWYDEPPITRSVARRPSLILYVDDNGTRRPLTRWATTIGGWSDVQTSRGVVERRWKESTVGPRVWRKLYAAPTWMPPRSTPDRDLVNTDDGTWRVKREVFGPGPRGAFGLMLLIHERLGGRQGSAPIDGGGIGTHGSASVVSILDGNSHGCHRLYNHLAVRLADFLLRHRNHVAKGDQPVRYRRRLAHQVAEVDTRGFLYELDPPVPIVVLEGTILSTLKVPPRASAPAGPD
ncbi:MAG TPA: L,D-transpeptidase [Kofleriaceae bacterium]